jgi:triacylglycerol lipase
MPRHHILLVPGFFGFGSLGEISYFSGIRRLLEQCFASAGVDVEISEVRTLPTASIRVRAACVREQLAQIVSVSDGPIHIVGHSTGGLDARLAIAPTASLPGKIEFNAYDRIRSVVTVCCSHFGSPVATAFSSPLRRRLLHLAARSFAWVLERGRSPLRFLLACAHWLLWLWRPLQRAPNTFDELFEKLGRDFSSERRVEVARFLRAVSEDEALVFQLTPAGCDLLNACTAEPATRYGSVVARAVRPSWRGFLRCIGDPYAQLFYPLYTVLYRLAARHEARWIPEAVGTQRQRLLEFLGELPSPHDNDGVSPTNSQIWGELVHATVADHLDVVGHFGFNDQSGFAGDWLPSHSGFDVARFERLWSDVASFLLQPSREQAEQDIGRTRTESS